MSIKKKVQHLLFAVSNDCLARTIFWVLFYSKSGLYDKAETRARIYLENNLIDNIYNFSGIKIPYIDEKDGGIMLFFEAIDIIFPFERLNWNDKYYIEGPYEQPPEVSIEEGDVVVDAGANLGLFSAYAAVKKRAAIVYAFEPVSRPHKLLQEMISLNGLSSKVIPVCAGLSDASGRLDIQVTKSLGCSSFEIERDDCEHSEIEVCSLDDFVEEKNIPKIDFIKADIEGAEKKMIDGAKGVLKEMKPKLAICTYHFPGDREAITKKILAANSSYTIKYGCHKLYAW